MWIASLTLRVYQCGSRSIDFTSFHSGLVAGLISVVRDGEGLGTGTSLIPVRAL